VRVHEDRRRGCAVSPPDVALVSGVKHISDEREPAARNSNAPLSERGSQTFVLTRERGNWPIALAQATPIAV
jgi:hypothetical protein